MATGLIVAIEEGMRFLNDAWEANASADDPTFSSALLFKLPLTLNGETYTDPDTAVPALIAAISETENGTIFEDDKAVSTSGKVAYHVIEDNGDTIIRLGFRDEDIMAGFIEDTKEALDGVTAYRTDLPSVLGTPPVAEFNS